MSGHTPGPDYLIGYDPPNPPDIGCATFVRADASGHVAVATAHVYDKEFGEELCRRWNAHADFLAACAQVVREVECHCADYPRSPAGSCPHCVCVAAVAKAGGA